MAEPRDTPLEDLDLAHLVASRLSLRSVASLATSSKHLKDRIDGTDSHFVQRLRQHYIAPPGADAADAAASAASAAADDRRPLSPPPQPQPPLPQPQQQPAGTGKAALRRATQCAGRLCTLRPASASFARAHSTAAPTAACVAASRDREAAVWRFPRAAVAVDSQLWFSSEGRRRRFGGGGGHTAPVDCLVEVAPGK
jgi:hypothetical protein